MQRRPFGQSGLEVSVLGFGAMQAGDPRLPEAHVARLLNHALDLGITLVDTARSYGISEERIGRHLAHRRDEYLLSTKLGYGAAGIPDWTYESVVAGVDAACNRLQTDVIDIVHLHSCALELLEEGEVVRALEDCRDAGKLRFAAYSGDSAALRYAIASGAFGSVQASVNLCDQEALRALREASDCGLGTIAKRPLAGQPWRARGSSQEPVHTRVRTSLRAAACRAGLRRGRHGSAGAQVRGLLAGCRLRHRRRHRPASPRAERGCRVGRAAG